MPEGGSRVADHVDRIQQDNPIGPSTVHERIHKHDPIGTINESKEVQARQAAVDHFHFPRAFGLQEVVVHHRPGGVAGIVSIADADNPPHGYFSHGAAEQASSPAEGVNRTHQACIE